MNNPGYQKLGQWSAAADAIAASRHILDQLAAVETADRLHIRAQTWNTQAQLDFAQGRPDQAFANWRQTTQLYRDLDYAVGITGSLINQARALEMSGRYRRACQTLLEAIDLDPPTCDFGDLGIAAASDSGLYPATEPRSENFGIAQSRQCAAANGTFASGKTAVSSKCGAGKRTRYSSSPEFLVAQFGDGLKQICLNMPPSATSKLNESLTAKPP